MPCQFRSTAPVTGILFVVQTSAAPIAASVLPARDPDSGRAAQAMPSVKVSVCIPGALVEDWDHRAPDSRISAFKDYVAAYVEGVHNTQVQYRMTEGAFAAFDPAAPDPRAVHGALPERREDTAKNQRGAREQKGGIVEPRLGGRGGNNRVRRARWRERHRVRSSALEGAAIADLWFTTHRLWQRAQM